jgi:hypothetical protein
LGSRLQARNIAAKPILNVSFVAGSRKPEAGSRKPEAGSRKPEAESRKPKAESRKPKAEAESRLTREG